jgi:hypothetical protein
MIMAGSKEEEEGEIYLINSLMVGTSHKNYQMSKERNKLCDSVYHEM